MNLEKDIAPYVESYVEGMSLQQALNSVMKMQTFLDEAVRDRGDFLSRLGEQSGVENGTYLAYIVREDSIKRAAVALREAIVAKFGGEVKP
jgi:hypothetical protein